MSQPIEARLADGRILRFPPGTDPSVVQAAVKRTLQQKTGLEGRPEARALPDNEFPGAGVIEPAMTMVSGALAEPVAGAAGLLTSMTPGLGEGSGAGVVQGVRENLTYQPRTQAGRQGLQNLTEFAEPVTETFSSIESAMGDVVYRATGSPALATAATSTPTALLELLGLASLKTVRNGTRLLDSNGNPTKALRQHLDKQGLVFENLSPETKALIPVNADPKLIPSIPREVGSGQDLIVSEIKSGATDGALAPFRVVGDKLKPDPLANEAIRQGFTPGFVQSVKQANKQTKQAMNRMLRMMRRIKADERLGLDFRPSDVVGDALSKRIKFMRDQANQARIKLNNLSRQVLHGKQINPEPIVARLQNALADLDIEIIDGPNGVPQPVYKGSLISKDRTSQKVINDLIDLMAEGGAPDALRFHKLKRQLDNMIDYRKKSAGGLSDAGKNVLKDIRSALNESLRQVSPEYARVNDVMSSVLGSLDNFQKAAGTTIDIFGEGADAAIGQTMRRLMSNVQSRTNLNNALTQINEVSTNLGGKFDTDIKTMVMFANGLDNQFGAVAKTSLKGEMESAVSRATQQGAKVTAVQAVGEKLGKVAEKLRGINDFNAFEAMESLLQ